MDFGLDEWSRLYSKLGYTPNQFQDMVKTYVNETGDLNSWLKRNWLYEHGYDLKGAEDLINWNKNLPTNFGNYTIDNYLDEMVGETLGFPIRNDYSYMSAIKRFPNSYQNSPEVDFLSNGNYPDLRSVGDLSVVDATPHTMSSPYNEPIFNNPQTWSYKALQNMSNKFGPEMVYNTINPNANDYSLLEMINYLANKKA